MKRVYTLAEVQKLMGETILAEREACAAELKRPQAHRWHLTPTECAEIILNRSRP